MRIKFYYIMICMKMIGFVTKVLCVLLDYYAPKYERRQILVSFKYDQKMHSIMLNQ